MYFIVAWASLGGAFNVSDWLIDWLNTDAACGIGYEIRGSS